LSLEAGKVLYLRTMWAHDWGKWEVEMDLGRQHLDSEAWISVHFRTADWIIGRAWLRESTVVIIALVLYSFSLMYLTLHLAFKVCCIHTLMWVM